MKLRMLAVTLTALAGTIAVVAPAAAEVEVHQDPRGDVERIDQARGTRTSADVLELRGEHAGATVDVRVDVVDLTDKPAYAGFRFRTPTGAEYRVDLSRERDGEKGVEMTRFNRGQAVMVDCPGLVGRFFDDKDRMVISVPRSCMNRPRWVRFGAFTAAASRGFDRVYGDDARRDRIVRGGAFQPALGSKRLQHD